MNDTAPILIFTFGNPSRGDDALGPALHDLLEDLQNDGHGLENVELLTDYQLQIENAVDLENRDCVIFVDASVSSSSPYEFQQISAEKDDSYTTHAMNPAAVLSVYQQINGSAPPPSYLLTIRGYEFDLDAELTEQAKNNLRDSFDFIMTWLKTDTNTAVEKR